MTLTKPMSARQQRIQRRYWRIRREVLDELYSIFTRPTFKMDSDRDKAAVRDVIVMLREQKEDLPT